MEFKLTQHLGKQFLPHVFSAENYKTKCTLGDVLAVEMHIQELKKKFPEILKFGNKNYRCNQVLSKDHPTIICRGVTGGGGTVFGKIEGAAGYYRRIATCPPSPPVLGSYDAPDKSGNI